MFVLSLKPPPTVSVCQHITAAKSNALWYGHRGYSSKSTSYDVTISCASDSASE
jgi:hypothetical protein